MKKRLSTKYFIFSQIAILFSGLLFLLGLYYILNIQYQKPANPFLNGPVTTLPKTLKLDLDDPENMTLTFQDSILISGHATPAKEVLIFTDSQNLVVKSKADGSFSTLLDLGEGVNNITVVVFDTTGDIKEAERTVYYSKEKI